MKQKIKILHLEDVPTDAELVARKLKKGKINAEILVVDNKATFERALKDFSPDIILSDHTLPSFDSHEALRLVKEAGITVPFILVTATMTEEFAVDILKKGAHDYIIKDRLQRLPSAVINSIEKHLLEKEQQKFFKNIIESEAMLKEAEKIAHFGSWQTDLLTGISKWSDEAYRIFGIEPGSIEPSYMNFVKCVHPDDKNIVKNATETAINTLDSQNIHFRVIDKDGSIKCIHSELVVESNKKKPVRIIGFNHDVTDIKLTEESLKKSEANLRTIFDNSDTGYVLLDKNLNILAFNQVAQDWIRSVFKIQLNEGRNFLTQVHFKRREKIKTMMHEVLKGEQIEYEAQSPDDSSLRWYHVRLNPVKDSNNKIIGLCKAVSDITKRKLNEEARKKAEAELQAEHTRLVFHLENTPLGFIEWDNQLHIKSLSKQAEEIFGWSIEEFSENEKTGYNQVYEEDQPWVFKISEQLLSGEVERNKVLHRNYTKDGRVIWCEWFNSVLKDKDGKVNTIMSLVQDVTERKTIEERLAYNETSLKEAQAIARVGNWEIDMVTKIQVWSDEMYKIFGINKEEATPSTELFLSFIHPDDSTYANGKIGEAFKTWKNSSFDFRFIRKDGVIRYGYSEWSFEFDNNMKPARLFGIIQDVTERKLAEMERTKMVNELIQRNKDLEQFAYIVSHNLRAPVANILGAAGELKEPGLSAAEKDLLGQGLNDSVLRLDNIVKDLNYILQVKHNINEPKEKVCFSELVDDIKVSIKNLIDKDHIEIKYDFSEIDELLTLKSYLYSIFYNLISNSIKYRQQQVPNIIEIKSHSEKNKLQLVFSDNGRGIDLEKRGDQVFGLYKQFHANTEGKGMGLFMVKTQVETLGGKISVKSQVNKGTEFKIEFE